MTSSLKSLQDRAGRRDFSHGQFTPNVLKSQSQGLVPKIQTGLNSPHGTSPRDQRWSKQILKQNGHFTRWDLLQGLNVAGTSPLVCADLNYFIPCPIGNAVANKIHATCMHVAGA